MAVTVSFPSVSFSLNQTRNLDSTAVPAGLSSADFSVDRTAGATPLNGLPQSDALQVVLEFSSDGGTTWPDSNSQTLVGGTFQNRDGSTHITDHFSMPIASFVNRVRGHVTALQALTCAGTISVT